MPLYFIKPVVWNTNGYQTPSGAKFTSGYPYLHGFGHEEWNNHPRFCYKNNGVDYRIFHTEGLGNQPLDDFTGDVVLFMVASNAGTQYLVGVAGGATSHFSNMNDRINLGALFDWKTRWKDAWILPSVQKCYKKSRGHFISDWNKDLHWTSSWTCPAESFLWPTKPIPLNPFAISGKSRLVTMYSSYQELTRHQATTILVGISGYLTHNEVRVLDNIKHYCNPQLDQQTDITVIARDKTIPQTTRATLTQARIGQGQFRMDLITQWNGRCAVTGCDLVQLLRASHIKPWRSCNNKQRLDPNNGLLLIPNLDVLFDLGLISFDDIGNMLVSKTLSTSQQALLGIPAPLMKKPNMQLIRYLRFHRQNVYIP
ncbi:hypothetical protein ThidrDRAFT_3060 [Thiorhodococcus drewsii AZ1]|uniref:HNH nuclease domain-containing protein n=1 Tax=Thiorhodococcus drewsii AZ1 TaxID=765913 RepID=G2E447_9GAMM|nr:HNH endonuclease [Thiorhodococcus drewsii]EGV29940.1 hypothetical protein ThidrDRAFT_3060 [Thiorhodococcus drewsii AZ1]